MLPEQKLQHMLTSLYPQVKIMALNQIYESKNVSPQVINAVEQATTDPDPQVAQKARWVLQSIRSPKSIGENQIDHPTGSEPSPSYARPSSAQQVKEYRVPSSLSCESVAFAIASLVIGSVLLVIGVTEAWEEYQRQQTIQASQTWPVSAGAVTSTGIDEEIYKEGGKRYVPNAIYQYTVNGIDYSCSFSLPATNNREGAISTLINFPIGYKIDVSYDPQQPQTCVTKFDRAVSPGVGAIFAIAGLAGVVAGILIFVSPTFREFIEKYSRRRALFH
jgi:hypothetical protein